MDDASEVVITTVVNSRITMTMTATSTNTAAARASVAALVDHLRDSLSENPASFDWPSLRPYLWAISILGTAFSFLFLAFNLEFASTPDSESYATQLRTKLGTATGVSKKSDSPPPKVDRNAEARPKGQGAEDLTTAKEIDKDVKIRKSKKIVPKTQVSPDGRGMTPVSETFLFQSIFALSRSLLLHLLLQSFNVSVPTSYISNQTFNTIIVGLANVYLEYSMHEFRSYGEQKEEVAVYVLPESLHPSSCGIG